MAGMTETGNNAPCPIPSPSSPTTACAPLNSTARWRCSPSNARSPHSLVRACGVRRGSRPAARAGPIGLAGARTGRAGGRLLETRPGLAIDTVADLAGLGSPEALRRHFRIQGLPSPSRYRKPGRAGA